MTDRTTYQKRIDRIGLSQTDAARILNVDPRTSRRWALGEVDPPPVVLTLLSLLEGSPGTLRRAERLARRKQVRDRRD